MFDLLLDTLIDGAFAAVAGFGFAYMSIPPKRTLFYCAFLAAIAHASRFWIMQMGFFNISVSTLIVSFLTGILGMIFAKRLKVPTEIIAFPALLPMVPGIYAYKSILAIFSFSNESDLVKKNEYLMLFFENAITTTTVSLALGMGVSVVLLIFYDQSLMVTRGARFNTKKDNL